LFVKYNKVKFQTASPHQETAVAASGNARARDRFHAHPFSPRRQKLSGELWLCVSRSPSRTISGRAAIFLGRHDAPMIAKKFVNAGDTHLYHFQEPSPYPGETFGLPCHGQCALYMYQNENDALSDRNRSTAMEMGRLWTAFAAGKESWEKYSTAVRFMRSGPGGPSTGIDLEKDKPRDYGYLGWLRKPFRRIERADVGLAAREQ
jgi:hypothetical protein